MNNKKNWWFENQYSRSTITIDDKKITIYHKGLTTFSLKKQTKNTIMINNINYLVLRKPTFWQCGYLYFVLKNEIEKTNNQEILLSNLCIAFKRKNEFKEAEEIKSIIDNLII
ncbi:MULTISPECIES: hypothetical protein [unclassified Spiroplasma]|uniref:hypothetical protein n=1 Tax=unclassified Spiroplasma TaxID=2637901 RepID=UPI0030D0E822